MEKNDFIRIKTPFSDKIMRISDIKSMKKVMTYNHETKEKNTVPSISFEYREKIGNTVGFSLRYNSIEERDTEYERLAKEFDPFIVIVGR